MKTLNQLIEKDSIKDKIEKIYEDYGQIHEEKCELNFEDGSYDGCTCAVKDMVKELIELLTEYFSYDIRFENEEQRKEAVKMYLNNFFEKQ